MYIQESQCTQKVSTKILLNCFDSLFELLSSYRLHARRAILPAASAMFSVYVHIICAVLSYSALRSMSIAFKRGTRCSAQYIFPSSISPSPVSGNIPCHPLDTPAWNSLYKSSASVDYFQLYRSRDCGLGVPLL